MQHFVGFVCVVIYHLLWTYTEVEVTWLSAVVMGAISGLVGIGIWIYTFVIHPNPPKVDFFGFFAQLFFAHIFFGLGAWIGYIVPDWACW